MRKCTDHWLLSHHINYSAFAADISIQASQRDLVLVWCFVGGSFCRRQFKINFFSEIESSDIKQSVEVDTELS